jgi:hypothetical protein
VHSAESYHSSVDTVISPATASKYAAPRNASTPPAAASTELAADIFSPGMIERDLQTEKLMEEMGQLRQALAAVTGSISNSRTASASGEALLPEPDSAPEWGEDEQDKGKDEVEDDDASVDSAGEGWLQRKRSPAVQVLHVSCEFVAQCRCLGVSHICVRFHLLSELHRLS